MEETARLDNLKKMDHFHWIIADSEEEILLLPVVGCWEQFMGRRWATTRLMCGAHSSLLDLMR
jgi:hypothetical protein